MTRNSTNLRHIFAGGAAFAILSFITGCATLTNPENNVDTSTYNNITGVEAVNALENNLRQSQANRLNIFAPDHYSTADKALLEARSLISANVPRSQVVQKVAIADTMLRNGNLVMRKVKDILEDQLTVKKKLDLLQTNKTHISEYGSLEGRLNKIIRDIESGNVQQTEEDQSMLLEDMQELERRSLRYNAMHEPEEILKRVKYRSGEKLAPLTYQDAVAVFQRAVDFIALYPNNGAAIKRVGQEALFAAKRALHITDQVSALIQKVNFSLEQVVLDEEYRLYRVARELDSADFRDSPLERQSEQLAQLAKNKAEEYRNKEELILSLRDTLIEVRDSSSQLTELSKSRTQFKKEKTEWHEKETQFTNKISHLENYLNQSQVRLDQTQQKLLAMGDENKQLSLLLATEKELARTQQIQASDNAKAETKTTAMASNKTDQKPLEENTVIETAPTRVQAPMPTHNDTVSKNITSDEIATPPATQQTVTAGSQKTKRETMIPEKESGKPNNASVAINTITSPPPVKKMIMKKETEDALNSVLDLISNKKPAKEVVTTNVKTFVDAGE